MKHLRRFFTLDCSSNNRRYFDIAPLSSHKNDDAKTFVGNPVKKKKVFSTSFLSGPFIWWRRFFPVNFLPDF